MKDFKFKNLRWYLLYWWLRLLGKKKWDSLAIVRRRIWKSHVGWLYDFFEDMKK